ncbi:DegT/DnrJ/EryC1/StrS family aminotransferase [Paucibacter sp. APW11]|uniref:DegT/DnrJ/EryC1/StrS family aminotransferase n=1 Tax=Roseateles aquae TaxID=3077235 RepID=A0ABU3PF83_9BURK|nr:DegT/DnrJ/EryC1/StrS family aminotransferase [Paucibacter sp. APW11]MDT9001236.1 DegT/DnrJ/EryC1/StrS family aminotransferase [Paucibacter sp. APW11]
MRSPVVSALRWFDFARAAWMYLRGGEGCLDQFRAEFAASLGMPAESVWLFGSGRAALHALVAALALKAGDEVLLPGYTCVVVPNVFMHLGLGVRYVDIEAGGFNPTAEAIAAAISAATRVVVVPHNFGLITTGLTQLRARFPGIVFIEDAAHAWGAREGAGGAFAGTLGQGGFYSFEYSKCLSTGLGGALLIGDEALRRRFVAPALQRPRGGALARQALTLAWHRLVAALPGPALAALQVLLRLPSRALGLVAQTPASELSGASRPNYAQGLHPLAAALGLCQLRRAARLWALRDAQARRYDEVFAGSSRFERPARAAGAVLLRYPLRLRQPAERAALMAELKALGIMADCWFDDVVHPRGSLRHGYTAGQCPVGEAAAEAVINLPLGLHAQLSAAQWRGLRRLAGRA